MLVAALPGLSPMVSHKGSLFNQTADQPANMHVTSHLVPVAVAKFAGPAAGASWVGSALLPATLAYTTVKGVGWNDWGYSGLNDLERKMNGVDK